MKKILMLAMVLLFPLSVSAIEEPSGFGGMKWGQSILPGWECREIGEGVKVSPDVNSGHERLSHAARCLT